MCWELLSNVAVVTRMTRNAMTVAVCSYPSVVDLPELDVSRPGRHQFYVQHGVDGSFGGFEIEATLHSKLLCVLLLI